MLLTIYTNITHRCGRSTYTKHMVKTFLPAGAAGPPAALSQATREVGQRPLKVRAEECAVGEFVEVESGQEMPWYGQIAAVRSGELPLAVRWMGLVPAKSLPEALSRIPLYVFRGGAHYVGVESIKQAWFPTRRPGLLPRWPLCDWVPLELLIGARQKRRLRLRRWGRRFSTSPSSQSSRQSFPKGACPPVDAPITGGNALGPRPEGNVVVPLPAG